MRRKTEQILVDKGARSDVRQTRRNIRTVNIPELLDVFFGDSNKENNRIYLGFD